MKKTGLFASISLLTLTACSGSNDFSPTPEMSGKDIFEKTCVECHAPVGEFVMAISADMRDADKIANKVLSGSMMMPSFPNIQGASAKVLSEYVLENSTQK